MVAIKKAIKVWKFFIKLAPREMVLEIETPLLHKFARGIMNLVKFFKFAASVKSGLQTIVSEMCLLQVVGHCLREFCNPVDKLFEEDYAT